MTDLPASQLLRELVNKTKGEETVSFGMINAHLSERGFAILMILFAFPMAIPLPYPPGFTTVLGVPLLIFSIQMLMGMSKPLLPEWMSKRTIKVSHLAFAVDKTEKYFKFIEKKLKCRLPYLSSISGERLIGLMSLLCSISIALPILFGNAVPSAGICIMALGLLSKDGIVIIIGMIVSVIGLVVSAGVVYLFFWGAKLAADTFLKDIYLYIMSHVGVGESLIGE
jgi:hypothetical protein